MVQIEKFQEKAYMEFQDYVTKAYPDDTYRSVNLDANLIDSPFTVTDLYSFSCNRHIHFLFTPLKLRNYL